MTVEANPRLFVGSTSAIHLGGLNGYGSGTIVFQTTGPLHFGGNAQVGNSGFSRGALLPAGTYRFELTGDDDLYAIAPAGGMVTVEGLSTLHADLAAPITLEVGPPDPNPVAIPSGLGEALWLVDQWGNVTDFTTEMDEQFKQGLDGRFGPSWSNQIDTVPGQDGGFYRGSVAVLGTEVVNIELVADNPDELRAKQRDIARAINPKRGPQTMHIVTADAQHLTIPVIFQSGMQTDPATDGDTVDTLIALTFQQVEPYWTDTNPLQVTKTKQTQTTTFFPVTFPVAIGESSIFRQWFQPYPGDVPADIVWIVHGGGSQLALINDDTGESLSLGYDIPEGVAVIADGVNQTVKDQYGNDLYGLVTGDIWQMPINGANITVQLLDPSDDAAVTLTCNPHYSGT